MAAVSNITGAVSGRAAVERPGLMDGPEHVIVGGRQEGKTLLATEWLDATPRGKRRVLVTLHRDSADEINGRILPYGDAHAISYRQLLAAGAEEGVEYGFDEVVQQLVQLFKLPESPRLLTICTAAPWQGTPELSEPDDEQPIEKEPLMRYFAHAHLPEGPLAETSRLFAVVARQLVETLPPSPERAVALRKLLEAKDAAVRSALDIPTG